MADEEKYPEITWQAPEFDFSRGKSSWFWISVLVALVLVSLALWQGNFLFAIFIIIAEGTLFIMGNADVPDAHFALQAKGIQINDKVISWKELNGFSLDEEAGERSYLYLNKSSLSAFRLRIPIPTADIAKIRIFLNNYLGEQEHKSSLLEEISKLLGF